MTDAQTASSEPQGELCVRTLPMPADTNHNGDIFGGWLLSQMDVAGGIYVIKTTKARTATVAIEAMNFRRPVYVGDLVSIYASTMRIGRTSITVHLDVWVRRRRQAESILVTDGNFTYVAIDDEGRPRAIDRGAISA